MEIEQTAPDGWIRNVRRDIVIYLMGYDPGAKAGDDRTDAP